MIAVLFARPDSVYKTIPGCDVWDAERDARRWPGGCPVIAHPPCRAWGAFAMFAKPRPDEKELALLAVELVRRWGGVLEHPAASKLWAAAGLPDLHQKDKYGGWTLGVHQNWWGHRARKATRLYIVGVPPSSIPIMPLRLDYPTHVIGDVGRAATGTKQPEISKAEREHTPPNFAAWLVALARRVDKSITPASAGKAGAAAWAGSGGDAQI